MSDKWRIYFSDRNDRGYSVPYYIDVEPGNPSKILKPKSEPILSTGTLGSFDHAGVMPTNIVTLPSGVKYMYYIGWSQRLDVPYHNTIGLAVSDDGDSWRKLSTGPVFGTSIKEPGYTGTICVMPNYYSGPWQAWYLSCREWVEIAGRIEPKYTINYATSPDGIDWDPGRVCIELQDNEGGISQASVLYDDNYKMYFSVRDVSNYRKGGAGSYRIEYAESDDGRHWSRKGECLVKSETGWDSEMVSYPNVFDYEGERYMFYNGNNFGQTGVGYAKATI